MQKIIPEKLTYAVARLVALAISICLTLVAALSVVMTEKSLGTTVDFAYPVATLAIFYLLSLHIYKDLVRIDELRTLAGVEWPFKTAYAKNIVKITLALTVYLQLLCEYLIPDSFFQNHILLSGYMVIVQAAMIFYLLGSSAELILSKKEGKSVYRDTISASFFSRQDLFARFVGRFDNGIIVGYKPFYYIDMQNVSEDKKSYVIKGSEHGSEKYVLIVYQKKTRKYLKPIIENLNKKFKEIARAEEERKLNETPPAAEGKAQMSSEADLAGDGDKTDSDDAARADNDIIDETAARADNDIVDETDAGAGDGDKAEA